ncbi:MAG: sulfite exporter TauE/SafE family protein [Oscillospiraceae bacterium]|nr:sulfite exporter TauE/SafE family protein [Oscillospiraceae bacterium]
MLDSLPVILIVGTVLGFLSGLGIGGGSLLIIWLTVVLGTDPLVARSINLLFFIPSALVACGLRMRQGDLKVRPLLPAILAGCVAAAVFSWVSTILNVEVLKKLFGVVLLAAGLRELFYRRKETEPSD